MVRVWKNPMGILERRRKRRYRLFLKTCIPHITFRAQFNLIIKHQTFTFDQNFYTWFSKYKDIWYKKYHCNWTPLHQWGGVVLAVPNKLFDWANINKILSIQPIKE